MSTLEEAIAVAARAHERKHDKAGAPYILHPLRVMLRMSTETERIAAVLNDVVEDTPYTLDELRRLGFSEEVVAAVEAVTKRPEEKGSDAGYFAFVERAARNPIARAVKLADLADNMDLTRIAAPTDADRERLRRYQRARNLVEAIGRAQGDDRLTER